MAKRFFYDCEFLEGTQKKRFLGITYGETKPTIDLISIGMVDEDGREFFAVSKDFNLEEAWFRHDIIESNTSKNHSLYDQKVYWIRDNVLKPIFDKLTRNHAHLGFNVPEFKLREMQSLIKYNGYTNLEISIDLKQWVYNNAGNESIEFYGYYSDYDHVCLSWLYEKMINLPSRFPMYTRDLKQMIDEKAQRLSEVYEKSFSETLKDLKQDPDYPKEENGHDAIFDALFNRNLYLWLNKFNF